MALFDTYKMTSKSERLKFLICEQVESTISGLFPYTRVLPFGSTVNSFGKNNSDLDMAITHQEHAKKKSSRLVFHTKGSGLRNTGQSDNKLLMSYLSFALKSFVPGCQDVTNIFHARVPIIKFKQDFMDIECDVSTSSSGYYMRYDLKAG